MKTQFFQSLKNALIRRWGQWRYPKVKNHSIAYEDDPLWDIVGMVKEDPADFSINHDKYLYGELLLSDHEREDPPATG